MTGQAVDVHDGSMPMLVALDGDQAHGSARTLAKSIGGPNPISEPRDNSPIEPAKALRKSSVARLEERPPAEAGLYKAVTSYFRFAQSLRVASQIRQPSSWLPTPDDDRHISGNGISDPDCAFGRLGSENKLLCRHRQACCPLICGRKFTVPLLLLTAHCENLPVGSTAFERAGFVIALCASSVRSPKVFLGSS